MIIGKDMEGSGRDQIQKVSRHLPEAGEDNHVKPQSGRLVSETRFEFGTSGLLSRKIKHTATKFSDMRSSHILKVSLLFSKPFLLNPS
jgi:hypothetical protein